MLPGAGTTGFIGGDGSLSRGRIDHPHAERQQRSEQQFQHATLRDRCADQRRTALTKTGDAPLTLSRTNAIGSGGVFVNGVRCAARLARRDEH